MSPSGRVIRSALTGAAARVRRDGITAVGLAVAGLVPAGLVVAWTLGGWGAAGAGPMVLWAVLSAAAVLLVAVLGRRWIGEMDAVAVTAAVEQVRNLPAGSLRGILELGRELPPGASAALFHRSESALADRLAGASPQELAGPLATSARRRRSRLLVGAAGLGLLAVVLGFATPDRARAAWTPLLHPVEHLRGPALPALVLAPGDTVVERGGVVDIRVDAGLRASITLHWRSVGAVPQERAVAVEGGRAAAAVGPVDSESSYWVRAPDGSVTDTFTITPRDPLMVTELALDITYPPHVGRGSDHYRGDAPLLRVPEGTRIRASARMNGPVAAAAVRHEHGVERAAGVEGSSFRLDWRIGPADSGRWDWTILGPDGERALAPAPLDVRVVEDAPPRVRVTFPGADTLMPGSLRQPVRADARDDHGLTSAALVFRRLDGRDEGGGPVSVPLAAQGGRSASLLGILDASDQPLVPGDVIAYHVVVRDNSPRRQEGRSATYELRLPTMAELRSRAGREADDVLESARRLTDRARELESTTRDLSRSLALRDRAAAQPGGDPGRGRPGDRLGFDEATRAGDVAGKHEEILSRVDELRSQVEALERALAEAGLRDPELERRMAELRDLYAQLGAPELRDQVDALREAVESLDPAAVRNALERLAQAQDGLRNQLRESLELMRRAAAEQEMNALAREAEELGSRQEALAEALAEDPSAPTRPIQQDELADRAAALTESLQSLERQLQQLGESESSARIGSAREQGRASHASMREAAEAARRGEAAGAAASGARAADEMADVARTLDEARGQMADTRHGEARTALQQATQEALGMAQRQESLRQEMIASQRQGGARGESLQRMRSEQAALDQGLEQVGRNLSDAARRSASVDRPVRNALDRARRNMTRTLRGLEDGGRMPVQPAERSVESLNELAMSLLENDARMARDGAGGGEQDALRELAQTAQEQGSLNGRASALAGMQLSERGLAGQLERLAEQQRQVGERIDETSGAVRGQEDLPERLDELSGEAERLARELEGGRLDADIMARQERLFHRLLDAGRSLERDEYSDERVGETAGRTGARSPGDLDPALLDAGIRYPAPTAEQLERLAPAYRRLILDYFDRLNRNDTGRTDPGDDTPGRSDRDDDGGGR